QNLKLDDDDLEILHKEKITGLFFLGLNEEKFHSVGFALGTATLLAKEIQTFKEKPKRVFSSYRNLKEVLAKYNIDGNGIGTICQFLLATYKLENDDKELRKLENIGTMLADSNEAIRCEYILTILHALLYIVKRIIKKELTLAPQLEVISEESIGRVDYAIKALEELIYIMEGKLH
ncbi:6703_t:CDS:2, partial [Funneliformis caledonium]